MRAIAAWAPCMRRAAQPACTSGASPRGYLNKAAFPRITQGDLACSRSGEAEVTKPEPGNQERGGLPPPICQATRYPRLVSQAISPAERWVATGTLP